MVPRKTSVAQIAQKTRKTIRSRPGIAPAEMICGETPDVAHTCPRQDRQLLNRLHRSHLAHAPGQRPRQPYRRKGPGIAAEDQGRGDRQAQAGEMPRIVVGEPLDDAAQQQPDQQQQKGGEQELDETPQGFYFPARLGGELRVLLSPSN